jgi:DNA polymerase-3 subunit alpha
LAKIIAYTQGFYVPRIDRKVIQQYKEDIIVLSGNLNGEIPNKILNLGENQAEETLLVEGTVQEDFYMEVMRHNQEDENRVNTTLISLARKRSKIVATNNTFYIDKGNANAHDILLVCAKVKNKRHNRSWSYRLVCLIRNTISRQGRR